MHTIGQNLSFQSTKEQAGNARLFQDIVEALQVAELQMMRLFVNFQDANAVGESVTNGRSTKANESQTTQFHNLILLTRNFFFQKVVRDKPNKLVFYKERLVQDSISAGSLATILLTYQG